MRAKRENSSTSCLRPSTSCTMVAVASSRRRFSAGLRSVESRRRRRWAESWMGVSGFLISCAIRWATSRQAARRWALSSSVRSSNTSTIPRYAPSGPFSAVAEARSVAEWPSRRRCTSRSRAFSRSRFIRWMRAASSECTGGRRTAVDGWPRASVADTPSMRSAAPLTVVMRPAASSESTPVATALLHRLVLGLEIAVGVLEARLGEGEVARHPVEGVHEHAQLVVRAHLHLVVEVARSHRARAFREHLHGLGNAPRQVEAEPRGGEHDDERHEEEKQNVDALERLLEEPELLVLLERLADAA